MAIYPTLRALLGGGRRLPTVLLVRTGDTLRWADELQAAVERWLASTGKSADFAVAQVGWDELAGGLGASDPSVARLDELTNGQATALAPGQRGPAVLLLDWRAWNERVQPAGGGLPGFEDVRAAVLRVCQAQGIRCQLDGLLERFLAVAGQ